MSDIFISPLSTLVSPAQLPEELNFISSGVSSLLNNVYYKDLLIQRSLSTSSVSYQLDIVSYSEILKLEIPGTGLVLLLNPDLENPNTAQSVIPVSLTWSWGIQRYIRNFKVSSFSFQPQAFYELIFKITAIQDDALLISAAKLFIEEANPLEKFAVNANAKYSGLNIPLPLNNDEEIAAGEILIAIDSYPDATLYEILFQDYIVAGSIKESLENLNLLFFPLMGYDAIGSLKDLFIPKLSASLQLSAGLEIPRSVLIPVKANGELELNEEIKTVLLFEAGEFVFNTTGDFGFKKALVLSFPASHPKAQIGNTGIQIGFTYARLDLSKNSNIPEADAAGYGPDFVGAYIQEASIEFTRFGQDDTTKTSIALIGSDMLIGTGGFSGTIGLAAEGSLYRKFGNFAVELNAFSLSFRQNSITGSYIAGKLTIPKFTASGGGLAEIAIEASMRDNGDFTIRALPQAEPYTVTFPEVFELKVRSAAAGSVDGNYYVSISGQLSFIADIPFLGDILPKNIELTKLLIWDDGRIGFEGGSFKVPKTFRLHIGPVNMEVGNIAFGAYQRKIGGVEREYRYFSFDGMVNTGLAGVNTTGNGIKYYFTVDDLALDHFISIDRLEIDLAIPGNDREKAAFLLNGFLSVSNPTQAGSVGNTEYTGSVAFSLPKLKIAGSAGMRLNPGVPAFVVDVGMAKAA